MVIADAGTLGGSALASWMPLQMLLIAFAVVVVLLVWKGRPDPSMGSLRGLGRAPEALERLTGVPGWAATAVGLSLFGLLVAGLGFYDDVSWHIALGRDDELFTAPHTAIVVGLVLILGGAVFGTLVATFTQVPGALRVGALRVPRELLPLWAVGVFAVSGFPLDEVWHRAYGVDVTMWSPTHMLMILGATFTPVAAWMVLGGAGVRARAGGWSTGLHVACAVLTLQGLVAPLGEFSFGVPQFGLLFAPMLLSLAAGLGLTACRRVLGPWRTLGVVALTTGVSFIAGDGPAPTRPVGLLVVSALVVELVARVSSDARPIRRAVVGGAGIGTVGLAAEWWWNQGAQQVWPSAMLPEAVILAVGAAVAGSLLAEAVVPTLAGGAEPPSPRSTDRSALFAGAAVTVVIVLLFSRPTGAVEAVVRVEPAGDGMAWVEATLIPSDAAAEAYWFQVSSWQGGGLELADMEPTGAPGVYRSDQPVPITGLWKTLLRLHRGRELMTVPIYLPADASIDEPEVPAVDRTQAFESEKRYLLRETRDGNGWMAPIVYGFLAVATLLWALAFAVGRSRPRADPVVHREPQTADR